MERKDRYILVEFFLTFLLLFVLTFLFGESVSTYRVYLGAGLVAGFTFSWFFRNAQNAYASYAVNAGVAGVFIWVLIALMRSSFFYSEVITIFIQGGIFLEIVLSFDSASPSTLAYLQALAFPLLLCFPAFVKKYDNTHITLVLVYLVLWAAILKVKFYEAFNPPKKYDLNRVYTFFLSLAVLVLVLFVSWQTFRHFLMGKIEKGGFLIEEGEQTKIKENAKEKEFYEVQDKLQNNISRIIPELDSKEDRQMTLYMLSQLLKESPDVLELKKAEKGLIDKLKRPGPGIEPGQTDETTILMDKYMNEKIALNSKKTRGNIMNSLKNNPFKIEERLSVADHLSKMQAGGSLKELNDQERQASDIINNSSVSSSVKKEVNDLLREAKGMRALELYRKGMNDLKKRTEALGGELREEFEKLYSAVDDADKLSDLEKTRKQAEELKRGKGKEREELMDKAKEQLKLKSEMFTLNAANRLKEKLDNSGLSDTATEELKEQAGKVASSRKQEEFSGADRKLREKMNEKGASANREADDLSGAKIEEFIREGKERAEGLLKEGVLPDSGKEFLAGMDKMESGQGKEKLDSQEVGLKELLANYYKKGFISQEAKDALATEAAGFKELLEMRPREGAQQSRGREEAQGKEGDYQQELKDAINSSSLGKGQKEALQRLADSLFNAATLEQIEDVNDGVKRELENSLKEGADKNELNSLQKKFEIASQIQRMFLIDEAFSEILKKTNDLERKNQEEAEKIKEQIKKAMDSKTADEFRKELAKLKDYLNSLQQAQISSDKQKSAEKAKKRLDAIEKMKQQLLKIEQSSTLQELKNELQKLQDQLNSQKKQDEAEKIKQQISKIKQSSTLDEMKDALDKLKEQLDAEQQASPEMQKSDEQKMDKEELENVKKQLEEARKSDTLQEMKDALDKLEDYLEARQMASPEMQKSDAKNTEIEDSQSVKEQLKKAKDSETLEDSRKELQKLIDYLEEQKQSSLSEKEGKLQKREEGSWRLYLLPSRLLLSAGSSAKLWPVAVYSNSLIKDPGSEVEWFSSNPRVAYVDQKGNVNAVAAGKAKITATYKNTDSNYAQVAVVERPAADMEEAVKEALGGLAYR